MTAYVALLRAVNVGGTGKLPMADLARMCVEAGFGDPKTYIASGNVVFTSDRSEREVRDALAAKLKAYAGKPVGVLVRTAPELRAVLAADPFPAEPRNLTYAIFLDDPPPADALDHLKRHTDERLALGAREIHVTYPSGSGTSRLEIPAAKAGTARNMNTVAKLAELATARESG